MQRQLRDPLTCQLAASAAAALAVCSVLFRSGEMWFLYFAAVTCHITLLHHVHVPVVKAVKNIEATTLQDRTSCPCEQVVGMQNVKLCAIMRAEDGRWRARPCTELYPNACRSQQGQWALAEGGPRGSCPEGTAFAVPRHAKENAALQRALQRASREACWLPLQGDSCSIAGRVSTCL